MTQIHITGVELEVRATPITGVNIIAGLGIVDAECTDLIISLTGEDSTGN